MLIYYWIYLTLKRNVMKTTLLLFLIFVGLGFSNNLFAQQPDCCNINPGFLYSDTSNCEIYFYPSNYDTTYDYSWDFGDGNTSSNSQPEHLYTTAGQYTVTLIAFDGSCSDTVTQIVSAQACTPPCNLNPGFTYYDTVNCNTAFYPNNFNQFHTYSWDFGDGTTSSNAFPQHEYGTAGTYNVTLTVSNDTCTETITQSVIVPPCPSPCNLNASFIYYDSMCYTGFIPSANGAASYFWDFGDGNTSSNSQPEHLYTTAGQYTVTLIAFDSSCSDTVTQIVSAQACTPPCNLNPGFTYYDTVNCNTAFYPNNFNQFHSYTWDFGDGTTSSNAFPQHEYSTAGTYNVTLTVSNDTCTETITQSVSVPPCPSPCNLNASFTYYDSMCYTGFIPSANGAASYFWDFGDGNTSSNSHPEHLYTTAGQYTVTLIAFDGSCSDTVTQIVSAQACTPPCNLNPGFIYYYTVNCNTAFYPNNFNQFHTYSWNFGDGTTSSNAFPQHEYGTAGTYNVTLTVSNDTCTETITQSVSVPPCAQPCALDASFSHVNTSGNTYEFSPNTFNSAYNYHWIFGDGTTSTDPNATHTYADEDDYFVTLVVSDCNCSASETLVVTVADSNNCGYNGDFTYQVENDGSYTFTPVYQSPNYEYYWTFGDGSSAYNMLPNYSYGTNGNFTVSLNIWEPGNGACSDTTYQNIQVNDSSACQLNSSFTTSTDTSNNVIHFYPDIYNPNYDYFWDFGDGQTSTFHSPNHSYSSNGMYTVTLTVNFDSCQSVDTTYIPMLSANLVNNEGSNSEVNIYPNPTSDFLTIDFNTLNSEKIQISLIDMNGKLIKQEFFTPNKGKNHKQINVQTISQGMYQLVLREKNGTFIHRVRFVKN